MINLNCDAVRERLPEYLTGSSLTATASIEAHLDGCAECRADAALLRTLREHETHVPAGLHERVIAGMSETHTQPRWGRRPLVLAASVAIALLGGTVLLRQQAPVAPPQSTVSSAAAPTVQVPVRSLLQPFPGAAEITPPTGGTTLEDLSDEQLKSLVVELRS